MDKISFQALLVLRALYRAYARALADGDPFPALFSGLENIGRLLPKLRPDSLRRSLLELIDAGYVTACAGDDEVQLYILTTSGLSAARSLGRLAVQALISLLKTVLPLAR